MGMIPVNQPIEAEKKPSALDNFAKILQMGVNLGGVASKIGDLYKPEPFKMGATFSLDLNDETRKGF